MEVPGTLDDIKNLGGKSLVYGAGILLLRAISFLLLPLYTRFLTPSDYGILAVATVTVAILGILFPLSLHGALARFYFSSRSDLERRTMAGTMWIAMILASAGGAVVLDRLGGPLFALLFREVPFDPYIQMAVWIAFFNTFGLLPQGLLQVQERPRAYVSLTVASTMTTVGLVFFLVVIEKQGAYGYLLGTLVASIAMAAGYVAFMLRSVRLSLRWSHLKAALVYSLPLVPHGVAGWVLELSDRVILERNVSLGELGLYSMGYQFGSLMTVVATAVNNAWVPFIFKNAQRQEEATQARLVRMVTYYVLLLSFVALGLALLTRDALRLLTVPAFHPAHAVVPWIVGGLLLNGLYFIPVNFLFLESKTRLVPIVTISSGAVNIGLNLWLVPQYGIMAAAWATFLAYGVTLVMVWATALRVYPVAYEYQRLAQIAVGAIGLFLVGNALSLSSELLEVIARMAVWLAFPAVLAALGFFSLPEKAAARAWSGRAMAIARHSLPFLRV